MKVDSAYQTYTFGKEKQSSSDSQDAEVQIKSAQKAPFPIKALNKNAEDPSMPANNKDYLSNAESGTIQQMRRQHAGYRRKRESSDESFRSGAEEPRRKRSASKSIPKRGNKSLSVESSSQERPAKKDKPRVAEMSIITEEKHYQDVEMSQDVQSDCSDPDTSKYLFKERKQSKVP